MQHNFTINIINIMHYIEYFELTIHKEILVKKYLSKRKSYSVGHIFKNITLNNWHTGNHIKFQKIHTVDIGNTNKIKLTSYSCMITVSVRHIVPAITVCPHNAPVAASSQEAQGEGCPSSTSDGAQGSQGCS